MKDKNSISKQDKSIEIFTCVTLVK